MVAALLALLPPLVGGGLYLVERLSGTFDEATISLSVVAHVTLVGLAIASTALAAHRRRSRGMRYGAWLVLLVGVILFSTGELFELITRQEESWLEELLRVAAFIPFAAFAACVVSPTRIVFTGSRQRLRLGVLAGGIFLVVAVAELMPLAIGAAEGLVMDGVDHFLALIRPFLDALLFLPLALTIGIAGLRHRCGPYVYVGLGILATLPADVLFHYDILLNGAPGMEEAAFAFTAVSLMYFIGGSLWDALRKGETEGGAAPAP